MSHEKLWDTVRREISPVRLLSGGELCLLDGSQRWARSTGHRVFSIKSNIIRRVHKAVKQVGEIY